MSEMNAGVKSNAPFSRTSSSKDSASLQLLVTIVAIQERAYLVRVMPTKGWQAMERGRENLGNIT